MKKVYLSILLFFTLLSASLAQQEAVSDLQEQLKNATGYDRIDLLVRLSSELISEDYDLAGTYAEEAYDLSRDLSYTRGLMKSTYFLAIYYRDKGKTGRAAKFADRGIEAAKKIGDERQELYGYEILKTIYMVAQNPKRRAEAELAYDQLKNKLNLAQRSAQLEELRKDYDTKEDQLSRSESERQEIEETLSQTLEEKLRKEAELAELARQKAELELEASELEKEAARNALKVSEKEKEILKYNAELRKQRLIVSLTIAGLIITTMFIFVLASYYRLKRKSAEEKIKTQRQLMMQEKMATLGQLTAGIAHEIKNPLNFVNNFAEGSSELTEELKETLDESKPALKPDQYELMVEIVEDLKQNALDIAQNGHRADRIIHSMMEHARGESGKRQKVDVNHLVRESLHLSYQGFKGLAPNYQVNIEEKFAPQLPSLEVIPQDFSRVLLNIFNNAHYAMNEKKNKLGDDYSPQLSIHTANKSGEVHIRIRDNGPGIPKDIRNKIFNPFFTTKPTGGGNTGLGLSISYDIIVQVHEGKLEVESEEGAFTEFIIKIPLNK